ncbi:MAG: pilus assembly protein PilM, partial [Myxococcaceae bacterium]
SRIEPRVVTHPAIAYQSVLINHPALFGNPPGAQPAAEAHVAIIDIGHERTSIAIGRAGGPLEFARTFAGGGKDLTRALAAEFNTALPDAEQWKMQHGALGSQIVGPDAERAAGAFIRGMQPILRELRSSLKSFTARTRGTVSQVYLCGGTARMPGIEEQFTRDLAIPAQLLPLPQEASTLPPEQHAAATQAFALALRGTITGAKAPRFNLRRGDYGFKGDFDYVKDKIGLLVGFGAVLLMLFIASSFVRNSLLARREKQVDAMLCDVTQKVLGQCEPNYDRALSMLKGKESPAAAVPKYSAANLLAELVARVPPDAPVTFDQIVIDLDRVTLRGETDNSKQIDKITTGLKTYKCFKEVKEGKVEKTKDGQKVTFRLDIQIECPDSAPTPPQG